MGKFNHYNNDKEINTFIKIFAVIIFWPIFLIVFIIKLLLGKK